MKDPVAACTATVRAAHAAGCCRPADTPRNIFQGEKTNLFTRNVLHLLQDKEICGLQDAEDGISSSAERESSCNESSKKGKPVGERVPHGLHGTMYQCEVNIAHVSPAIQQEADH